MDIRTQDLTPDDIALLPSTVSNIAHIAGLEAAITCVNAFGGTLIRIPKGEANNVRGKLAFDRLEAVCGRAAALLICAEYGGELLNIPRCRALSDEIRNRTIRRAFDAGEAVNVLARRFGMTYRAIETILNGAV